MQQSHGDYSDFVTYHLMTAISLMAFGLRFILPLFVTILFSSAFLSILYAYAHGIPIIYAKFSNYYIVVLVCFLIAGEF